MTLRSNFAALALIGAVSISFAKETRVGSTSIKLTPPQGQCELTGEKDNESLLVARLRDLLAKENQLIAMYADYEQLAQLRSGKRERFDDFAQYLVPTRVLNSDVPASVLGQICAVLRSKTDRDLAAKIEKRSSDLERLVQGVKINEIKLVGVLAEDATVCYSGQLQKFTDTGTEIIQAAILATMLLKQKLMTYQIYTQSVEASLERERGGTSINGYLQRSLALVQIDYPLSFHVELSVSRIVRHFFPDPRGEVEFLISALQLYLCKHYTV
jgi:hypothetical protein